MRANELRQLTIATRKAELLDNKLRSAFCSDCFDKTHSESCWRCALQASERCRVTAETRLIQVRDTLTYYLSDVERCETFEHLTEHVLPMLHDLTLGAEQEPPPRS